MGLLALGIDNPNISGGGGGGITMVAFTDFCTTAGMEQFLPQEDCNVCADTSVYIVMGFLVTMAAYLPTFATGILRLYRHYDVNCQKCSAGVWSALSLIGYITVLYYYHRVCLASLYEGQVIYTSDGTVYEVSSIDYYPRGYNNNNTVLVDFQWKAGVGQILFMIGFALKIIDFICNCCIATPTITRTREQQWEYEDISLLLAETMDDREDDPAAAGAAAAAMGRGDDTGDVGVNDDDDDDELVDYNTNREYV